MSCGCERRCWRSNATAIASSWAAARPRFFQQGSPSAFVWWRRSNTASVALQRVGGYQISEAALEVAEVDLARNRLVQTYFGEDPTDPHAYDLTMDASRFETGALVAVIVSAMDARRMQIEQIHQPVQPPAAPP
ncbi:hypothetical protein Pla175_23350 [Pirellulimonas nuda]|uniref:Uncharacterized protein n=1 Tax=Pirellulimonas nuda TaxID=2528009 RepID=A0A518DBV2_9BACT|nr:hypothetical protein Pla175_23350 [Pirellulimonas nuda]